MDGNARWFVVQGIPSLIEWVHMITRHLSHRMVHAQIGQYVFCVVILGFTCVPSLLACLSFHRASSSIFSWILVLSLFAFSLQILAGVTECGSNNALALKTDCKTFSTQLARIGSSVVIVACCVWASDLGRRLATSTIVAGAAILTVCRDPTQLGDAELTVPMLEFFFIFVILLSVIYRPDSSPSSSSALKSTSNVSLSHQTQHAISADGAVNTHTGVVDSAASRTSDQLAFTATSYPTANYRAQASKVPATSKPKSPTRAIARPTTSVTKPTSSSSAKVASPPAVAAKPRQGSPQLTSAVRPISTKSYTGNNRQPSKRNDPSTTTTSSFRPAAPSASPSPSRTQTAAASATNTTTPVRTQQPPRLPLEATNVMVTPPPKPISPSDVLSASAAATSAKENGGPNFGRSRVNPHITVTSPSPVKPLPESKLPVPIREPLQLSLFCVWMYSLSTTMGLWHCRNLANCIMGSPTAHCVPNCG
jgi:hypothetical protein